jgi:hypothetical protein
MTTTTAAPAEWEAVMQAEDSHLRGQRPPTLEAIQSARARALRWAAEDNPGRTFAFLD